MVWCWWPRTGGPLEPADRVVVLTGFRPDLSFLSEIRLDLDPVLQAPRLLAAEIDPNIHSCGSVSPHGAAELAQPEAGFYLVGMKSYGRAPTFLAMTGYEQVRSVAAELAGDHEAAARVELTLPDTGVCGGSGLFDDPDQASSGWLLRPSPGDGHRDRRSAAGDDRRRAPVGVSEGDGLLAVAARPDLDRVGLRRILVTLCVTQVTSWGILYYAFPVLSGRISAATGWSPPALTAAFSAGLVVSAVAGVGVGRWIDRHGPRGVMTLGSVVAVLAVVAIAVAPTLPVFVGAWLVAGVAMAGVLYPPAFAALTRWYGPRSVGALTVLTLAGGFASTIFAPITAALADHLDWRGVYLVLAGVLAVVTIPAHAVGLRRPWPQVAETSATGQRPRDILTSRPFIALAAALALAACASHAAVVNLVPLLTERGIGIGVAAVILGLGGAGQVLGRLGYAPLHRRLDVRSRTVAVCWGWPCRRA